MLAYELLERIAGPLSILPTVQRVEPDVDSLPLCAYAGDIPSLSLACSGQRLAWISGVAGDDETALLRLVGEGVERYAWRMPSRRDLRIALHTELNGRFCSLSEAGLIYRMDIADVRHILLLQETRLPWLAGTSLTDARPTFVPVPDLFPEHVPSRFSRWVAATTNGIASGLSQEQACLHAGYELIERDATMTAWYGRRRPRAVVELGSVSEPVQRLLTKAEAMGLSVLVIDVMADIPVPVAFALVYDDRLGCERLACGSAANLDISVAAEKALFEAAVMWNSHLELRDVLPPIRRSEAGTGFRSVVGLEHHVQLYTYPWARAGYDRIIRSASGLPVVSCGRRQEPFDPAAELTQLLGVLRRRRLDAVVLDITPDDVRSTGFCVVKVIIPGLVPLLVGRHVPAASRRLDRTAVTGSWPHPFP